MRHLTWLAPAALLALLACHSTGPYTAASAGFHTALAAGLAAAERASGGCYATCVGGTVCNPRTGFCEEATTSLAGVDCAMSCAPHETCAVDGAGLPRCVATSSLGVTRERRGLAPASGFSLGLSPASGTEPPPPVRAPEPGRP